MKILLTGGAGYIGSHSGLLLVERGHQVEMVDNFSTGVRSNVSVLQIPSHEFDVRETDRLADLLREKNYDIVIHFAGSAYVPESFSSPEKYYQNNVVTGFSLLEAVRRMERPSKIVFSSTCATYGIPERCPISEETPQNPISPYGRTKLIVEWMLSDYFHRYRIPYDVLRYFNAAGCHPEGILGENHDPEPHLIPRMVVAALSKQPIQVNGDNFPTRDGTCVRDYIHVWDLAMAHALAAERQGSSPVALNLGSGTGTSILEIAKSLEKILGYSLNIDWLPPREGDPPELYADASLAGSRLNWQPAFSTVDRILSTTLNWFESREISLT